LFGKLPVVGFTSMLKLAGCPAGTEVLGGVIPIVKSKFWLGIAVNVTDAERVIAEGSLPRPTTLKLYACDMPLDTVTVNAAPPPVGTALDGLTTQLGGAVPAQPSATVLL